MQIVTTDHIPVLIQDLNENGIKGATDEAVIKWSSITTDNHKHIKCLSITMDDCEHIKISHLTHICEKAFWCFGKQFKRNQFILVDAMGYSGIR